MLLSWYNALLSACINSKMRLREFLESSSSDGVFTEDETSKCGESGDCAQCGLCCIVFTVSDLPYEIPEAPNQPVTELFEKGGFELCRHMREDLHGRLICACQGMKDHPSLQACRSWNGNETNDGASSLTSYDTAVLSFWFHVIHTDDPEDILAADIMVKRGIAPSRNDIVELVSKEELITFLEVVFRCESLPVHILDVMYAGGFFRDVSERELMTENSIKVEFANRYLR